MPDMPLICVEGIIIGMISRPVVLFPHIIPLSVKLSPTRNTLMLRPIPHQLLGVLPRLVFVSACQVPIVTDSMLCSLGGMPYI